MADAPGSAPPDWDGLAPFSPVFEQSRIPLALIDEQRRYVMVNDATIDLYKYPREAVLGQRAGWRVIDDDPATADAEWEELRRTGYLYGERVIEHANGTHMRVSYAAHATTLTGRWLAVFVTLAARFEPDGRELIRAETAASDVEGLTLTDRERQVVRLVALGLATRRIAAELSVSPETVRSHVRNAMAKTGAHTRAQLVALALAEGMIER